MSEVVAVILTVSLALMIGDLLYRALTKSAPLLPRTVAVLIAACVVYLLAPGTVEKRGSIDETASVVFCYLSMLFGMIAEYGYVQAERGRRKFEFDLVSFLMPIFASPIVFIPLLTLTSEVAIGGGAFTRTKLMVYLVAFQNGFFWKSFFEQRRAEVTSMARVQAVPAQTALADPGTSSTFADVPVHR
jgi:hypothetical protein